MLLTCFVIASGVLPSFILRMLVMVYHRAALPQCASRIKAVKVPQYGSEFSCSELAVGLIALSLPS